MVSSIEKMAETMYLARFKLLRWSYRSLRGYAGHAEPVGPGHGLQCGGGAATRLRWLDSFGESQGLATVSGTKA